MGFTPEQIKGRIKSVAKQNNADARTLMRIYMMERFLERLAQSEYRDNFIIKGGILVTAMIGVAHRSTMDIDTSMKNLNLSAEDALRVVNQVKDIDLDDGVSFEVKDVSNIMDEMEYPGIRVTMNANVGRLITPLKIDISTGDVITPRAIEFNYDLLLEDRSISLWSYNLETILAEKLQTVLARGILNTRMRDFYDIRMLLDTYEDKVNKAVLKDAFAATCKKRGTDHLQEQAEEIIKIIEADKSKKNNNDRTQYRQKNHHEAIVSREVFNAANHLRASRNYSKKNRPLPVLSVVEDGILRGYVPFDKDWTGFSAEEYREASESVMKEPDVTVTADVKKRLDLTGYEIVRVQYFSTMQNPAMTISNGRLRFNTACLKKFENVEYVELLLNSVERCIAIRPCDKNNPNAIRWGRLKEGRWCASTLGCRGLAKTLFDIMEWDEDLRYRFRGQFLEQGDNKMMLFAFDEPEMIKVEEIVLPPKENTEEDEGETVKKKIYIFPPEWAGTFGQPITSIAQVGILRQEHYAGNWDVFRPATEIEEMNIFTAESLNELLREAEKIMEGWTDYR